MELAATATLSIPIAKKLIEAIWDLLKEKKLDELKQKLTELITLSNNTGLALEKYIRLLKYSTEASVHSTELQSILEGVAVDIGRQQFTKLRDVRMQTNLRKEGIDKIYQYRDDYEKAKEYYEKAEQHLANAQHKFSSDTTSCIQEMEYTNQELDKLVMMVRRRIDGFIEALIEAYKVLEKMK
jgi:tetratricopeptide (TPR) repeat protein